MWFLALAADYDGTLARHGLVDDATVAALRRFRQSGRRTLLVTGRPLGELLDTFPQADVFDRIVAENGALLYRPETREEVLLTKPADMRLAAALEEEGAQPLSIGKGIIATWEPHQHVALEAIHRLGLELEIIFNKGAVMILPSGVNKASGLDAALRELRLSRHNVAAVGDAENDHAFLEHCGFAAAVANALPRLKETVDFVTGADHGDGVQELIARILESDPAALDDMLRRHRLVVGQSEAGEDRHVPVAGHALVLAGPSRSGKSTLAMALAEQLENGGYQTAIIDPEGDYEHLAGHAQLGNEQRPPLVDEVMGLLEQPDESVVVNLIGLPVDDRPRFFAELFPRLFELRTRSGGPHWIHVDEAYHLLPATWQPALQLTPQELSGVLFVVVQPETLSPAALKAATGLIAVGRELKRSVRQFARGTGEPFPAPGRWRAADGEDDEGAVLWLRGSLPQSFRPLKPRHLSLRHRRKYAVGELKPEDSFYFIGPEGQLRLRAQNLGIFLQTADGVDDGTWEYHLRRHDYSAWIREKVHDDDLADEVERLEDDGNLSPEESRRAVRTAIDTRYTAPA